VSARADRDTRPGTGRDHPGHRTAPAVGGPGKASVGGVTSTDRRWTHRSRRGRGGPGRPGPAAGFRRRASPCVGSVGGRVSAAPDGRRYGPAGSSLCRTTGPRCWRWSCCSRGRQPSGWATRAGPRAEVGGLGAAPRRARGQRQLKRGRDTHRCARASRGRSPPGSGPGSRRGKGPGWAACWSISLGELPLGGPGQLRSGCRF